MEESVIPLAWFFQVIVQRFSCAIRSKSDETFCLHVLCEIIAQLWETFKEFRSYRNSLYLP